MGAMVIESGIKEVKDGGPDFGKLSWPYVNGMEQKLDSSLKTLRALQRLPDEFEEVHEDAKALAQQAEAILQKSIEAGTSCDGLPLPPGLLEFFDVAAQVGVMKPYFRIESLDIQRNFGSELYFSYENKGALATLATNYDEDDPEEDVQCLCV